MSKKKHSVYAFNSQFILTLGCFFLSIIIGTMFAVSWSKPTRYSFFIEFNTSYGLSKGTSIRMRGVQIGFIQDIQLKLNSVLILAQINSDKIIIPRNSIIETTQTGLLNEPSIDIIPLQLLPFKDHIRYDPFSDDCNSSSIICSKTYLAGDRGLNYDDLVRSTTRISQRFDDPRFFNLFYIFLQNSIELTENFLDLIASVSDLTSVAYAYLERFLSNETST